MKNLELSSPFFGHLFYFTRDFSMYLILVVVSFVFLIYSAFKIQKQKISEKRKKILTAFAFTIFAIIFTFTAFESYFRYRYDVSDGLGFLKVSKKWDARHVVLNNEFSRDRNFEQEKQEGVTRIGVLGDSIAAGGGIENITNRFSNILEAKLRETGKKVEVYNLGRPGYDTSSEILVYDEMKQYNFDIIVWEYFVNDVQPGFKSSGTPIIENSSKKSKLVAFISDRSYFFDFMYWRLSSKYQKTFQALRIADIAQYKNEPVLNQHYQDIKTLLEKMKEQNSKVVVIMFPSNILLGPDYPTYIHEMMGKYFRDNGAQFYDLLQDLKDKDGKTLIASKFDPHPNEIVHEIAGEKLYELLLPTIK
ncbi:MAG: SGNH/GDSL hydrolase family protein [Candidatus Curtissbacteria bacterium]|nr:SGNH/GDSL hydrolase family protein [Candidatus Curtissbacteria bacterium]